MNSAMENYEKDGDEKECVLIVLGIFFILFYFKKSAKQGASSTLIIDPEKVLQRLVLSVQCEPQG